MPTRLPESKHFKIEPLADGVYAAIASEQGYAICNAGIIDIGDKTIVFDTFISPIAAEDLLKAAKQLTPHEAGYVVNSHYHNDHIRGNQVFPPDVDLISTTWTREAIAENEPKEVQSEKESIPQAIIEAQEKLATEKDPKRRRELAVSIVYCKAIVESHPQLKTRLPNITFEPPKLVMHGTKRTVELLSFAGHTASDTVLYLPREKIAFMSDLLFINMHPYLPSGFPERWKESLSMVRSLGVQTVIPGHGPVGGNGDLSVMIQYIQSLENIVANMIESGRPVEEASLQPIPPQFQTWLQLFDDFFVANLQFLYQRAAQGKNER